MESTLHHIGMVLKMIWWFAIEIWELVTGKR